MKVIFVVGILLSLILLVSITQQSYAATTSLFPKSPPKKTVNTYVDEGLGFQINIPSGWHEGSLNDEGLTQNFSLIVLSPDENARINIAYQQLPTTIVKTTPDKFSKEAKTNIENFTKEYMKKNMKNIKFGKLSAMYYTNGLSISLPYSQSINTGGQTSQLRGVVYWYFLIETGDMYVLETLSTADSYKTYQSSFLKAVNSFYVFPE